jgi:hypothetical protein
LFEKILLPKKLFAEIIFSSFIEFLLFLLKFELFSFELLSGEISPEIFFSEFINRNLFINFFFVLIKI